MLHTIFAFGDVELILNTSPQKVIAARVETLIIVTIVYQTGPVQDQTSPQRFEDNIS